MDERRDDIYRIDAHADKRLFVTMLVKDIELLPAIIDLVDNSVDGAKAIGAQDDLSSYEVRMRVSPDEFQIEDNCGGISLDIARHYAFRFGRPEDRVGTTGAVGQFGVGMKRAFFKLGSKFSVASQSTESTFSMSVNVEQWLQEQQGSNWTFKMDEVDSARPPGGEVGTQIRVWDLHETVREDFSNTRVLASLREQVRLRHQASLAAGLQLYLNGERLTGIYPSLLSGDDFAPVNQAFPIQTDRGDVFCRIVAGIVDLDRFELDKDEGNAELFPRASDAGWWLFCNGRLLLFADRTNLTAWGDGPPPAYHPQYRRFRGYVYLTSDDSSLLPWNTTKTSVDQDSRVWRIVRSRMKLVLIDVVNVINRLKNEQEAQASLSQHDPDNDTDELTLSASISRARMTPLANITPRDRVRIPQPPAKPRSAPRRPPSQSIQYSVDRDRYEAVASELDAASAADVGRSTFDYFFEREVDQ